MLAGVPVTAITYARELLPTKYTARAADSSSGAQPSEGGPGVSSPVHLQTPLVGAQGYSASSGFSTAVVILFLLVGPVGRIEPDLHARAAEWGGNHL